MQKLYQKSELFFALLWIGIYVIGTGIADGISETLGVPRLITFLFHLALSAAAVFFVQKHGLRKRYGLCRTDVSPSAFLFYLPLLLPPCVNLLGGVTLNYPLGESLCYFGTMLCVGFLEELIFRGFLFRAMEKDTPRAAIWVSSLTFGIGHLLNLFTGNAASPLAVVCQVFYAAAFGYLFVLLFSRGKSLLPCIFTHSAVNALSVFSSPALSADGMQIATAVFLLLFAVIYSLILHRTLPKTSTERLQ